MQENGERRDPMYRMQRTVAFLLFALILLSPGFALAEGESTEPAVEQVAEGVVQETEKTTAKRSSANDPLCRQIQDTYAAARKRSHRKSFKGYCGAYVANQLVILGINTSYLSGSGKNTYDIYRNMDCTEGGYDVTAYSGKQYSLREAMEAILREDPAARNILVGFQRGVSSSGKKYGHALFIHGVLDGKVYFSDSSAMRARSPLMTRKAAMKIAHMKDRKLLIGALLNSLRKMFSLLFTEI